MSSDDSGSSRGPTNAVAAVRNDVQSSMTPSSSDGSAAHMRGNLDRRPTDLTGQSERAARYTPPYRAPFFPSAAQPEIIRANQKDLYYLAQLVDQATEVARAFFGTRWVQTFAGEIGLASSLAYYGLTNLLGRQTLGEEYVDILQYDVRTKKIPTAFSRTILLLSHVLAPYVLAKAYERLRSRLASRLAEQGTSNGSDASQRLDLTQGDSEPLFADEEERPPAPAASQPEATGSSVARLPLMSLITDFGASGLDTVLNEHIGAIHLAVFYLFGRYYHLAKRFVGIRYLSLQGRIGEGHAKPPSYELLGALMGTQLSVRLIHTLYKRRRAARAAKELAAADQSDEKAVAGVTSHQVALVDGTPVTELTFDPDNPNAEDEAQQDGDAGVSESRKCTLCLSKRRDPAATECGHCFCYECIVGWVREKPECPLCRQKVNISHILPLYNV